MSACQICRTLDVRAMLHFTKIWTSTEVIRTAVPEYIENVDRIHASEGKPMNFLKCHRDQFKWQHCSPGLREGESLDHRGNSFSCLHDGWGIDHRGNSFSSLHDGWGLENFAGN
uniref:Uncharacterized protein n=1 Tax=Cacopsylla melanoneura TaxID=428564 RepID=A0A8D8UQ00_9HEMI